MVYTYPVYISIRVSQRTGSGLKILDQSTYEGVRTEIEIGQNSEVEKVIFYQRIFVKPDIIQLHNFLTNIIPPHYTV